MAATSATCFVCCGCNRLPNCVHWGSNDIIAYGAEYSVALYQCQREQASGAVLNLLEGHKGKVHCVKWLDRGRQSTRGKQEIISGAADNDVIVWEGTGAEFHIQSCLRGHTGPVTAIDGIHIPSSQGAIPERPRTLIVSASVDSSVRVWERKEDQDDFELKQTITFGNGFALDVALGLLCCSKVPVLAIGGDDTRVHLYILQGDKFTRVQVLRGHEDWIRGLEFAAADSGDLLLASCSQDCFIRLWRITKDSDDDSDDIKLKGNRFTVTQGDSEEHYVVSLESVLAGHEQWIYGLHWQSAYHTEDGDRHQPMCLLSASMDKTMIVWQLDAETGVWVDKVRVGEVGGNTLGLYGCQFSPDGNTILAHGFQGAFHVWTTNTEDKSMWGPAVTVSGHFQSVQDVAWDPQGAFFISVSTDQTTRLFAPWRQEGKETTWHEIARPQVHGYDMQCLAMIGRFKFVSGADEKVLRVFEAPVNFLKNFQKISKEEIGGNILKKAKEQLPEGASVPALGLSNKAVFQGESGIAASDREIIHPSDQYTDIYFEPVTLAVPPTEEHLLQNTLWPETQKLYGHGFEIFSVAAHPEGTLIASSCKASKAEHATIILWDTTSWLQVGELSSHALTVTQLAFSRSGKHLLAVSRDRTWSLFEEAANRTESEPLYRKVANTDKKTSLHSRIIWGCSWSHDDRYFATASRDKKVIIWGRRADDSLDSSPLGDYGACSVPLDVGASATAIDFAPVLCDESYVLAVGLESGEILIYKWRPEASQDWMKCPTTLRGHTMTVKRLRWRPLGRNRDREEGRSDDSLDLLSCSADCSVFLQTINRSDI